MSTHPFRFGVQLSNLPASNWQERARKIESLGFSTLFVPDHFSASLWDPTTMLGGVAAVTDALKVGTLVYGIDYRHPVIYARQAATLQIMSNGRHEFGLGAGWMVEDYEWAGLPYDRPSIRIERLDEALTIIRSMWSNETTTFSGKHYQVADVPLKLELDSATPPPILIGGGGPKLLSVAGKHADIVGINPMLPEGRITAETPLDMTPERVAEKIEWLHRATEDAGRDFDAIELNALVFTIAVTDDPKPIHELIAGATGLSEDQIADSPLFLVGSADEITSRLEQRREQTGISYIVVQGDDMAQLELFAEHVVAPLTGR
jgi:probable F420-dependent oxidoreductase